MRIFVSIAAYRDPELASTVRDLVEKAAAPEALTLAVLEQDDAPLSHADYPAKPRLRIEHCPPAESRGVCWARARIQRHYDGEEYYLQLDSHHRFVPGWDAILRAQLACCPAADPILSAYLPWYFREDGREWFNGLDCGQLVFSHYDHDGIPNFKAPIPLQPADAPPAPGSFVSGHFIFSRGDFVTRVPYDPEIYFTGEEISLAARAFTHGFDIFHPARAAAWHYFNRAQAVRHWDDHAPWPELQQRAVKKLRRLFAPEPYRAPQDGLGTARTLAEYEQRTGLDLRLALSAS